MRIKKIYGAIDSASRSTNLKILAGFGLVIALLAGGIVILQSQPRPQRTAPLPPAFRPAPQEQSEPEPSQVRSAPSEQPAAPDEMEFLNSVKLDRTLKGDFDAMVKRRYIRALVVYSKTLFFLDGAQQKGASYDGLKEFEKTINENLGTGYLKVYIIFIPVRRDDLLTSLVEGKGDIAAANLTITPERSRLVDFSDPLMEGVNEVLVTASGSAAVNRLEDLSDHEIFVRRSSSYYEHLEALNESLEKQGKKPVRIIAADEYLEDEDLLEMVNAGVIPATIVDSHMAEFWARIFDRIRLYRNISIHPGGRIAWAFRKGSPKLQKTINSFLATHRQGTLFGNLMLKRYLQSADYIKNSTASEEMKKYKSMVNLFKKYAGMYDFDYLMVAAQAYQESRLDQSMRSKSGAIGVMQVKKSTAGDSHVNIRNIEKLDRNIEAGVKYMRFMMNQYFRNEPMDPLNKSLFAVASYNAGPGRISQLRESARRKGYNPNVWFRNVEVIAAQEMGRETVQYVSNIFKYYVAYKQIESQILEKEKARHDLTGPPF